MNLKQKFGLRVKELRKSLKMTQEQLAEILNMETPNISRMENGLLPKADKIQKLAEIFDVPVFELFKFNHFENREAIQRKIIQIIEKADDKELSLFYKIITDIKEYKS